MPWKEVDKMTEKENFINEMLKSEKPFKHLCQEYGISEKTGYKWKKRFYEEGKTGLQEQSRATKTHSNALEEDAIITDPNKVVATLNSLCVEMDNRYSLLKEANVRSIKEYNAKFTNHRLNPEKGHRY